MSIEKIIADITRRYPSVEKQTLRAIARFFSLSPQAQSHVRDEYAKVLRDALTGRVSPKVMTTLTETFPEEAAASLTRQLSEAQLRSIGETLGRWTETGRRPRDAGKFLTEVTMLDSNRAKSYDKMARYLEGLDISDADYERRLEDYYQKLLRERRDVIAHTEGRQATSTARKEEGEARGSKWKRWITVGDDRVGEDHEENEDEGIVPIDYIYSHGEEHPPGRPNCRCTMAYLRDETKERLDKRKS